jgi:hypothetical protein
MNPVIEMLVNITMQMIKVLRQVWKLERRGYLWMQQWSCNYATNMAITDQRQTKTRVLFMYCTKRTSYGAFLVLMASFSLNIGITLSSNNDSTVSRSRSRKFEFSKSLSVTRSWDDDTSSCNTRSLMMSQTDAKVSIISAKFMAG